MGFPEQKKTNVEYDSRSNDFGSLKIFQNKLNLNLIKMLFSFIFRSYFFNYNNIIQNICIFNLIGVKRVFKYLLLTKCFGKFSD